MVNLINSIPTANDGVPHKDNNNNAIKHFESNKVRMLGLLEKNYENLVEVFTNNAIANISNVWSFNPTLSLPTSMTFKSDPYNESKCLQGKKLDIYDDY